LPETTAIRDEEAEMKIFWSWQSDTDGKTGRFLIRDALQDAIDKLRQAPDVEEPVREDLHLDHDIQGISGSPDLARTIFGKIEGSEVVVADVTLVGATSAGKKLINSNVAIELGYALHARTDQNVLLVFNAQYGKHEDLPFDLRHKGGAIVFNLGPSASREEVVVERKSLTDQFARALKPFVERRPKQPTPQFEETRSTYNRAVYFSEREPLAFDSDLPLAYPDKGLCYLRLIPKVPLANPLDLATLKSEVIAAPLLRDGGYRSVQVGLNKYGAISCTFIQSGITASTQLFRNGEVWCVSSSLIRAEREGAPDYLRLPYLSVFLFEQIFYVAVRSVAEFATKRLKLEPPWDLELGLAGVSGLYLNRRSDRFGGQEGPIHRNEIVRRASATDGKLETLDELLLSFFSEVFDSVGERRPPSLYGFPPDRPNAAKI
jgi:hypothetical protein